MLIQTVRRLDRARFEPIVVSLRPRGPLSDEAERSGAKVIHLGLGRLQTAAIVGELTRLFRRERVAIVHAYLFDASIVSRLAGRLAHVPVVLTSTRASLEYLPRAAWWLDRFTARWCRRILAVSQGTADFVVQRERIPAHKVVVVPNGVDVRRFQPGDRAAARARWDVEEGDFVVACVGRLHEQKGHRHLFEALAVARRQISRIVCLVAGDGPRRAAVMAEADALGLEHAVRFLGHVQQIHSVYDAADVVVLPSLYEGMSNVLLEAMAMERPVIATAVEGSAELVRPGETGFLVPPGDEAALEEALVELAGSPSRSRAMGVRARQLAERHHSIDNTVSRIEELYLQEWGHVDGGADA